MATEEEKEEMISPKETSRDGSYMGVLSCLTGRVLGLRLTVTSISSIIMQ